MTTSTHTLDEVDRALVGEIQRQFPLDHRPFQILGQMVNISEQECLDRVGRLKAEGIINRFCGIFDARALGYHMTLVAMRVPAERVHSVVKQLNTYPGMLHQDVCDHRFNIWSVVVAPPPDSLEHVVRVLHTLAEAEETMMLPPLRRYTKVRHHGVTVWEAVCEHAGAFPNNHRWPSPKPSLGARDFRLIQILQEDLPLLEIPYTIWAEQADVTEPMLFNWIKKMEHLGAMRRFSALINESNGQLRTRAMVMWKVPQEQVDSVGEHLARLREVGLCYRTPMYPNWPYPLATLVHAKNPSACLDAVQAIETHVGAYPHEQLFSLRQHRREPLRLFTEELDLWWSEVGGKVNIV